MAYSNEQKESIFSDVLTRIEKGEALRTILRDKDKPSTQTFYIWLEEDESKSKRYENTLVKGKLKRSNLFRVNNARKTNSSKFPDGYLYIIKIEGFNLYKIGVSNKPKRRIRDIQSYLPFDSDVVFCEKYSNVYNLENNIHIHYNSKRQRKEWFDLSDDDLKELINTLKEV